jgi:F420-dependent oxidoreductase-like protein
MKLGLTLAKFTWPCGPKTIARDLREVAVTAEDVGFAQIGAMDHVWQCPPNGPPEDEMLEAYTTLGYLAAHTSRIELMTWMTAAVFRQPGLLAKLVTTLDVLSEGRARLGIGAAWYELEARGLGMPFPPVAERFERLEEVLQVCLQMWSDSDDPFIGTHYRLERTLNSPQPLTRPHPPITVGGSGEKKTLRLVAQYAQACNLFPTPDLEHKLDVLRGHCEAVGRDYDEIEKTVSSALDPGPNGENVDDIIATCQRLAGLGVTLVQGSVPDVASIAPLHLIGERIIPVVADF